MRKVPVWLMIICGHLAFGLSFPVRSSAQAITISVDPSDNPLVINGRLDGQATTFSGNVRLTANEDVNGLMMLAEDLGHSGPGQDVVIDRTNIAINSGIKLSKDQPQDVRVTVSRVSQAGEYTGKLTFLAPGKPGSDRRVIELKLNIQRALEGRTLRFEGGKSPLVIKGTLDKNTSTFHGYAPVTAAGGDVAELQIQSSDLEHQSKPNVFIDRSNVAIPPNTKLTSDVQREVRITVSSVKWPGKYTGTIQFLLPGEALNQEYAIPLQLTVDAEPDVKPENENLSIQLVRTGVWDRGEKFLARCLLRESIVSDEWPLQLRNQTLLPVQMLDGKVVAHGEKSGYVVGNEMTLDAQKDLPANQTISLPLMIQRNKLSADRYTGTLRFKIKDSDKSVTANLDLSLRDGPLLPMLVVVLGILFGRLARKMETPGAKIQVTLLPKFYRLREKALVVSDGKAVTYVAKRLSDIRSAIDEATLPEQNISSDLDKLETEIERLTSLQMLERALQSKPVPGLESQIAAARTALIQGEAEEFDRLFADVKRGVERANEGDAIVSPLGHASPPLAPMQKRVEAKPPYGMQTVAMVLAAVSGTRLVGAEIRYWLFRPLLYLTMLGLLALLGLQTLYVNAGATFGSGGLYDYLGLFLWGISADVAQRIMQAQR